MSESNNASGATPSGAPEDGESALTKVRRRVGAASAQMGDKVSDLRERRLENAKDAQQDSGATPATARTGEAVSTAGPTTPITRRTRKARLRLARLDPWSVMKTVFLFSIAGAIVMFIATWVVWGVINASGVFDAVNKAVHDLVATPGSESSFRLEDYVNTHRVLGLCALIGALDVLLLTALATLGAFLYNLAATVMGGLEVTLAED